MREVGKVMVGSNYCLCKTNILKCDLCDRVVLIIRLLNLLNIRIFIKVLYFLLEICTLNLLNFRYKAKV